MVIAASAIASAESAPSLPARTAAQLLAEVVGSAAKPVAPFTGTIQQTSDLGLPSLPAAATQGMVPAALAGGQSVTIWYRDPQHIRLAVPVQAGESDVRLDGRTLWLWDSKTQTATHVMLPAAPGGKRSTGPGKAAPALPATPQAAARQIIAAIGPSTSVTVPGTVYVASHAAYQLAVMPKVSGSLVSKVLIAIDASRHIPLSVQVFARGVSGPAFAVGFTALTFATPAMSNFTFTPPPGAKVKTQTIPSTPPAGLGQFGSGKPGAGTPIPARPSKQAIRQIERSFAQSLPKSLSAAERTRAIKAFDKHISAATKSAVLKVSGKSASQGSGGFLAGSPATALAGSPLAALAGPGTPTVIGKGWLSVVATPPDPAVAAAVRRLLAKPAQGHSSPFQQQSPGVSGSAAYSSSLSVTAVRAGPGLAVLRALLQASQPAHGTWGHGRLLTTSLLSVLIISNGRILAGPVTPAVLYHDAALSAK